MVGSDEDPTRLLKRFGRRFRRKVTEQVAHFIVVVEGSEFGKKIEITLNPIDVGRRRDNHFVLADPCVSNHHCTISFRDGQVHVQDRGSTNGTFIDDEKISGTAEWPLTSSLRIGNQVLRREYRQRDEMRREDALAEDLRRAARYVQSLLPPPLLRGPMTATWRFVPSTELGGDVFDYFWLDADHFAFYLLDVCGHGTGAALHSVSVFNLLRQRSLHNADFFRPAQVLKALNESMPMDRFGDMYFTVWYGIYRPDDRRLTFAAAGPPPALLFDTAGNLLSRLESPDPPIGVVAALEYTETVKVLPPGSLIYLYSDGVYEMSTKAGDMWSCEEFIRLVAEQLRKGHGDPDLIYQQVRLLAGSDQVEDDFSLLRFHTH